MFIRISRCSRTIVFFTIFFCFFKIFEIFNKLCSFLSIIIRLLRGSGAFCKTFISAIHHHFTTFFLLISHLLSNWLCCHTTLRHCIHTKKWLLHLWHSLLHHSSSWHGSLLHHRLHYRLCHLTHLLCILHFTSNELLIIRFYFCS